MEIITVPHPTLRTVAEPVTQVDTKILRFIEELGQTLESTRKPRGVGLAAPQVDKKWRVFVTRLPKSEKDQHEFVRTFINPVILDQSERLELGTNPEDPDLEGCLSIPGLYGPVPRSEWITLEYQILEGNELKTVSDHFEHFPARVVQHELDHLNGILFTDHSLHYDLPVYRENLNTKRFEEVDRELIELL